MWRRPVKHCATLIALATLAGLSTGANAADFSYSYLEVTADLSKTRNTAPGDTTAVQRINAANAGLCPVCDARVWGPKSSANAAANLMAVDQSPLKYSDFIALKIATES